MLDSSAKIHKIASFSTGNGYRKVKSQIHPSPAREKAKSGELVEALSSVELPLDQEMRAKSDKGIQAQWVAVQALTALLRAH